MAPIVSSLPVLRQYVLSDKQIEESTYHSPHIPHVQQAPCEKDRASSCFALPAPCNFSNEHLTFVDASHGSTTTDVLQQIRQMREQPDFRLEQHRAKGLLVLPSCKQNREELEGSTEQRHGVDSELQRLVDSKSGDICRLVEKVERLEKDHAHIKHVANQQDHLLQSALRENLNHLAKMRSNAIFSKNLEIECKTKDGKIEELEIIVANMSEVIGTLRQEAACEKKITSDVRDLEARIKEKDNAISQLEKERNHAQYLSSDYFERMKTGLQECEQLKAALQVASEEKTAAIQKVATDQRPHEEAMKRMQTLHEDKDSQLSTAHERICQLEIKYLLQHTQIRQLRNDLELATKERITHEKERDAQTARFTKLTSQINDWNNDVVPKYMAQYRALKKQARDATACAAASAGKYALLRREKMDAVNVTTASLEAQNRTLRMHVDKLRCDKTKLELEAQGWDRLRRMEAVDSTNYDEYVLQDNDGDDDDDDDDDGDEEEDRGVPSNLRWDTLSDWEDHVDWETGGTISPSTNNRTLSEAAAESTLSKHESGASLDVEVDDAWLQTSVDDDDSDGKVQDWGWGKLSEQNQNQGKNGDGDDDGDGGDCDNPGQYEDDGR